MSDFNPAILLHLGILIPLAAAVILFAGKRLPIGLTQVVALAGFLCPALIAIWLWTQFSISPTYDNTDYRFYSDIPTGLEAFGISLKLGLNGIAMPLYVMAGIVGLAAGIYALFSKAERLQSYLCLLLIMQAGLMGVFASIDIFFLYFFHEFALIPTFIMIGYWGGQGRRVAAMEMTIYLTLGAMISLLGLIALYSATPLNSFDLITLRDHLATGGLIGEGSQRLIFGMLLFGFGILVSLFPFHSWAPRGYAAAPTSAAMLHAGVLKKFGLYGLIQVAAPLLSEGAASWTWLLVWLALGNIVVIGLVAIAQRDLKLMIGYSSVMHMGACFLGIACLSVIGVGGAVFLMFGHGLSVALMFLLANAIVQRTGTSDMGEMGGLCTRAPVLAGFFVAATMASIGLPGFANFWGEITIFIGLWQLEPWLLVPAVLGVVISAIYGLRAVARVFFGEEVEAKDNALPELASSDMRMNERLPAGLLLAALLFVGFWPSSVGDSLNRDLELIPVYDRNFVEQSVPLAVPPVAASITTLPTEP